MGKESVYFFTPCLNFIRGNVVIIFFLTIRLFCHGPDQVDHNFYLYIENEKLLLRWEIPVGEILGYVLRQKMDTDKDNLITPHEQDIFIKQFTQEHLKNLELLLNGKKDRHHLLKTEIENGTNRV
ncbi:MAG: hypothetical protein ACK4NF_01055, partial [Planctomycetota bacterium]